MDRYEDRDGKAWSFAPPNHSLQEYIDVEIHEYQRDFEHCRNGYDNQLPNWVTKLSRIQQMEALKQKIGVLEQQRAEALRRVAELTSENTILKSELDNLKLNPAQLCTKSWQKSEVILEVSYEYCIIAELNIIEHYDYN